MYKMKKNKIIIVTQDNEVYGAFKTIKALNKWRIENGYKYQSWINVNGSRQTSKYTLEDKKDDYQTYNVSYHIILKWR